jgi:hypothetical protein
MQQELEEVTNGTTADCTKTSELIRGIKVPDIAGV